MRRLIGLDWRIFSAVTVIMALALSAVLYSRLAYTSTPAQRAKQQECVIAQKTDGAAIPKECKSLIELTTEDPVALYTSILTFATVLLFIATAGLWYMAWRQSRDTKEAILASQSANDIARQALEQGQRPWLGFDHSGPSEIRLHFNTLRFSMSVAVHNHGNSPAAAVHFGCVLIRPESGMDVWGTLRGLADLAMREVARGASNPVVIFPGQTQTIERIATIDFSREEIDRQQLTLFADYFLLVTYRHPSTGRAYCTATGYGSMREACPTYSLEGRNFDVREWPVHVMPGCNFVA